MAKNPMQKKVTNAFLLGVVLSLVIAAAIGALLFVLVVLPGQTASRDTGAELRSVYVVTAPVRYGDEISHSNISRQSIMTTLTGFDPFFDELGESVENIMARIDLEPGTILTRSMIIQGERIGHDERLVEFNMFTLPIDIHVGDYIDVRLTLPTGQDLVVVSRQRVIALEHETVTLQLTEQEILMLNNAIVESYVIRASNLHIVRYVEPGLQTAATPTYQPSPAVRDLITANPNIVAEARQNFAQRYSEPLRTWIDNAYGNYAGEAMRNIEAGIAEQQQRARDARQQFLMGI